jgi:hypothetical protein
MLAFFIHFFIGLFGSIAIFVFFFRLSAAQSTSAPFGLIFFALACGVLAIYLSPWATPAALLVYFAVSLKEHRDDQRHAQKTTPASDPDTSGT